LFFQINILIFFREFLSPHIAFYYGFFGSVTIGNIVEDNEDIAAYLHYFCLALLTPESNKSVEYG